MPSIRKIDFFVVPIINIYIKFLDLFFFKFLNLDKFLTILLVLPPLLTILLLLTLNNLGIESNNPVIFNIEVNGTIILLNSYIKY